MITKSRIAEDLFWIRQRLDQLEGHQSRVVQQFHLLVLEMLEEGGIPEVAWRRVESLLFLLPFTDEGRKELVNGVEIRDGRRHKEPPL
jgi:hypothetical protein